MQKRRARRRKHGKRRRQNKKILVIILVILSIFFITILSGLLFWEFGSASVKGELIKFLSKQPVVRDIVADW